MEFNVKFCKYVRSFKRKNPAKNLVVTVKSIAKFRGYSLPVRPHFAELGDVGNAGKANWKER